MRYLVIAAGFAYAITAMLALGSAKADDDHERRQMLVEYQQRQLWLGQLPERDPPQGVASKGLMPRTGTRTAVPDNNSEIICLDAPPRRGVLFLTRSGALLEPEVSP